MELLLKVYLHQHVIIHFHQYEHSHPQYHHSEFADNKFSSIDVIKEKIKNENAVIIQQSYRGHQGRKIAGLKHIENQQKLNVHWKKNFEAMRVKKAIVIQKYVRRHIVLSGSVLRKRKSERRAQRLKRLRKKKENSKAQAEVETTVCLRY